MYRRGYYDRDRLPVRRQSRSPTKYNRRRLNLIQPPPLVVVLKFAIPTVIFLLFLFLYFYEPHIEIAFYNRNWVFEEIEVVPHLAGCFEPSRVSPRYNLSEGLYGRRKTEVQAGVPLRFGLDCYSLAGTIQNDPSKIADIHSSGEQRIQYHTYWRTDLVPFGPRQEWMLKSYFATQNLKTTRLVLWSNSAELGQNEVIRKYARRYRDAFAFKVVDVPMLSRGTALEGSPMLGRQDSKAWIDGDLIRLLLLWHYGGVWVDMDSLLTRDLEPLLEHEFVSQWDCYDKAYQPFNGALMRFLEHSPYLCEAFHIMATSKPPRARSTDWGALLYFKLWRRLVAGGIPPFKILPFCFSDARSCRLDNRLPDPFTKDHSHGLWTMGLGLEEGGGLDKALNQIFAVHLHNQWEKEFPQGGWVERLLLNRYQRTLDMRERS